MVNVKSGVMQKYGFSQSIGRVSNSNTMQVDRIYILLVALACVDSGQCRDAFVRADSLLSYFDQFSMDVIALYKLTSQTVILGDDEIPKYCISSLALCISSAKADNLTSIAQHLADLHKERKQDGIIFMDQQKIGS